MHSDDSDDGLPEAIGDALLRLLTDSSDDRAARIEELCRHHPEHAETIRRRAADHDHLIELLHRVVDQPLGVGAFLGRYRILGELGKGGMGRVYLAEERGQMVRRVAIKVIELGLEADRVLTRFAAERQALARMEHDNIAKVLDAGASERGLAYFVMEYVKGEPITKYCDDNRLSLRERLRLFRQVCAGVQHAHQKGVLHRDLKPDNVLVTVQGGSPVAKIIDFGLARATDHRLVQQTLYTEMNRWVGTPLYMSPEQAGLGRLDVDTRTDIYALGVMLYELLSGTLPFTRQELEACTLDEMRRKIREDDPPRPSTRIGTLDKSERDARLRRTNARSLVRRLRGELDWMVMKALEKDRTRRYATADAFSADVRRHLRHEPVEACPPSAMYRLRKLLRRYRGQFTAAGLVAVTLIAGVLATGKLALDKARILENYRNLMMGAQLQTLERRAQHAHPTDTAMQPELADLVRQAEVLVARAPELEAVMAELSRGCTVEHGERSTARGPYPEDERITAMRSEADLLEKQKEAKDVLPADRAHAETEIAALRQAVREAELRRDGSARVHIEDAERQFLYDSLEQQTIQLRVLRDETLVDLRRRLEWASTVRRATVDAHADKWHEAIQAIASMKRYEDLGRLEPQEGLVPLGPDPLLGWWEFAHVASGAIPRRVDGVLELGVEHGIVFVLIPSGTVRFGFDDSCKDGPESYPEHRVRAFLIAKHELSRAQWMQMARDVRGLRLRDDGIVDVRNRSGKNRGKPANGVTWLTSDALLRRYGLDLPTEVEWEYACKADGSTIWNTGNDSSSLVGAANLGPQDVARGDVKPPPRFPDEWPENGVLAPVFWSLRPNAFGLVQMHGNVAEWCKDTLNQSPRYRALRGGSCADPPSLARSIMHDHTLPSDAAREVGLRPVRRLSFKE